MAKETTGAQVSAIGLLAAGKQLASLTGLKDRTHQDLVFVNQRPDADLELDSHTFEHCVFVGLGLKGSKLTKTAFKQCTFVRCYLRSATITSCDFTGSRFEDCDFSGASIMDTKLIYSRWRSTEIDTSQILSNIPEWPNVAHELLVEMRNNALAQGYNADARWLHQQALVRTRIHQYRIMVGWNDYYKKKFGLWGRIGGGLRWAMLNVERWVWGHGEQPLNLIGSGFFSVLVLGLYYHQSNPTMFGAEDDITLSSLMMSLSYSVRAFAGADPPTGTSFSTFGTMTTAEAVFGMIFTSLLAAVVFRWISTRQF